MWYESDAAPEEEPVDREPMKSLAAEPVAVVVEVVVDVDVEVDALEPDVASEAAVTVPALDSVDDWARTATAKTDVKASVEKTFILT
ncbi:hypothetical protein PC123_g14978 [Phytophthora cactorum]|nr:hypothetical protein PC123_g14978 [Phytophthora cactorum]